MTPITLFDTEYLSIEGSMRRFWSGTEDPDPVVVQIGAVKIDLDDDCSIIGSKKIFIKPVGRNGEVLQISSYLEELTGISDADLMRSGVTLSAALQQLDAFSEGGNLWSWGKDELVMMGISCFLSGIAPVIKATRFGNCKDLLLSSGMSPADIDATNSGQLAGHFGLDRAGRREHDALDDAISLAETIRHLCSVGALCRNDFQI